MSEMVERVAKALEMPMVDMSTGMTPQRRLELMARAAIEAMREPTDEMEKAGAFAWDDDWCTETNALNMWQAMIDAALKG
jgi:hypothetical protein